LREAMMDDGRLTQYVLGLLPEADAERVDEASIVDETIAVRLRDVENDLVDAYVCGALDRASRRQFERAYLVTARRREKVEFARRFLTVVDRAALSMPDPRLTAAPRRWRVHALLAVAALLLVASGVLLFELPWPRGAVQQAQAPSRAQQEPLARALVLTAQTRSIGTPPAIAIEPGIDRLAFELRLEAHDFSRYRAALKDSATNRIVWRSAELSATFGNGVFVVPLDVPADVLSARRYAIDLAGIGGSRGTEPEGSYLFEVDRQ